MRKFHKSLELGCFQLKNECLGRDFDSRNLHYLQIVENLGVAGLSFPAPKSKRAAAVSAATLSQLFLP